MPTFAVTRIVTAGAVATWRNVDGRRMTFLPQDGSFGIVGVPYAPVVVEHKNLGADFATVSRVGRVDALVYKNPKLPTMSYTLKLASPDRNGRAQSMIDTLTSWARRGVRLRVAYGRQEAGLWRITELSVSSEQRHPTTSEIVRASVAVDMTRASDIAGWGPVDGGPAPPPGTPPPGGRTYEVVAGDTLIRISIKMYGTPNKWQLIADANHITDPSHLPIGKLLRIP